MLRAGGAAVLVDTKPVLIPVHATATAGYVWDRTKTFAGGLLTWITGLVGLLGALVAAGLVYRGRHRARAVRP